MNEGEARRAVGGGLRVRAKWAHSASHDLRAEGRVMAYSPAPMVLIMTDGGERIWWKADLVDLVAADNPGRCACDNDFDGDNLCMPSACQWEGIEHPQERCATSHIHDAVCDQDEIGDWWHPVSRSGN